MARALSDCASAAPASPLASRLSFDAPALSTSAHAVPSGYFNVSWFSTMSVLGGADHHQDPQQAPQDRDEHDAADLEIEAEDHDLPALVTPTSNAIDSPAEPSVWTMLSSRIVDPRNPSLWSNR